jgi:2-desacetyl-2-hydroxyethyl bacteriochlorophyllide A dehydrogenase
MTTTYTAGDGAASDELASSTSRALWFTGPCEAELREETVPAAGESEIVVRSLVSLVSAGTEMNVYRGEAATTQEVNLPTTSGEFPFPIKFAYQVVGEVEQAGAGSGYSVGDRVFVHHPHQERFRVATARSRPDDLVEGAGLVYPVPSDLDPARAAFANLFSVAYNTLLDVPVRIGDVVAVSGLGVIGSLAAYLARLTAGRLILVDPIPERRERAAWIGADAVVPPADAPSAIEELSDGRGIDVYIEASGATPALQGAIDATGQEGTIAVLSYYGRRQAQLRLSPEFHTRRQRIISCYVGVIGSGLQPRWDAARRMREAMQRLSTLDVDTLTSHRVPFDRAVEAYEMIDRRPEETLGVLIEYGGSGPSPARPADGGEA